VEVSLPGWRKSSRSEAQGACVEVSLPGWRRASQCVNDSHCVEVAARAGVVLMRDSKDPDGPVLAFSVDVWQDFIRGMKEDK
jgi:CDP-diacylglycerol pyrophosphatase